MRAKKLFHGQFFLAKLVAQDHESALNTIVDIELMPLRLVIMSVFLYRFDQVGDSGNAFFDGSHQLDARDQGLHPVQRVG